MPFSHNLAIFSLVLVTLIWGFEFVLVHNAIETMEPHTFNTLRFGVGALFVLVYKKIYTGHFIGVVDRSIVIAASILGFMLFVGFYTQTKGMLFTSVTNTGFITGLNVVLVPVLGTLFFKEKVSHLAWIGVMVALVGLVLMTGLLSLNLNKGDLLVLICAFAFALHINATGKVSNHFNVLDFSILQMLSVSVFSAVSAYFTEDWRAGLKPELLLSADVYIGILVAGILGTGFALIVQTWAQKGISPTKIGLIYSIEPVAAGLSAWLMLNETMAVASLVGAALILLGMIIAELPHDFWLRRWIKGRIH